MARLLFLLCLGSCSILFAQQHQFRNYSIEQGLSQSVVNCVMQDSRGFIWIGTQNGLNRFDGYGFTEYLFNPDDTTTLSNNWIYGISEDRQGDLWIGTKGGLNRFIRKENRFRRFACTAGYRGEISPYTYDVLAAQSGKVYVNTPPVLTVYDPVDGGFSYFPTGFPYETGIGDNRVPLMEDRNGDIWMATNYGLACYRPKTGAITSLRIDLPGAFSSAANRITALCSDSSGNIWVGATDGLFVIRNGSGKIEPFFTSPAGRRLLTSNFIRALACDKTGALWIGTEGGGINRISRLKDEAWLIDFYSSTTTGLGHNIVNALAIDRSQNLWAGTLQGISKTDLKPARFRLYRRDNTTASFDLLGNVIASIYKDDEGRIWVGNWGQGLNILDRKTRQVEHFSSRLSGNHHIPNDFVHVIFPDENRNIWIGTRNGIFVFDPQKRQFIRYRDFFRNPALPVLDGMRIYMIIRGKDESYWIATQAGVYRILPDRKSYERFTAEAADPRRIGANLVYCLMEDREGLIWMATINGLDAFDPGKGKMTSFRKSDTRNSLCDNFVISLGEDANGDIWIGTSAFVNRFVKKDSTFIYYNREHGIPRNNIFEILRDDRNTMWFATGGGLCRFEPSAGTFRNYTVDDGLQSLEFNLRACFKSPDGEVFFGGMNGFNSFYPERLSDNPHIPQVVITAIRASGKEGQRSFDPSGAPEIVLSHTSKAVAIEFVALEFTNPEKNRYAYMLEGMSNEWIQIGNQRSVLFSNLSPGTYTFRVKGSNNDGLWNETGATLKIVIMPPWWRSWWAWTAYILVVTGAILIMMKFRERNLIRERDILEKKVHDRTIQIEQKNEEILHKNEALSRLNSELQGLNETKDKFFSIIAHDLRNPFNSIIGLADIVLAGLSGESHDKTRKAVSDIREASRHAFDLLQNLLIWARSQTGNLDFQPVSFDLTERIEENIELVRGQAARKNIMVIQEADVPLMVEGDIHMVNTILRNLLTNAIKFTPREGRVTVGSERTEDHYTIRVCDNGIGLTPEIRSKIFRIDSKYTRKGTDQERGTGLGLILCKEFAEKHGGSISVESEPGKGSCFTVLLKG